MNRKVQPVRDARNALRPSGEEQGSYNKSVKYGVLLVLLLVVICIVASGFSGTFIKTPIHTGMETAVSDGWRFADGTPVTSENRKGLAWSTDGTLSVSRTVSEQEFGKALYFRNHRQDITVMADGQVLYDTYGSGNYHLKHCFNGYCMVVLPQSEQPYTVEIRIAPTTETLGTVPEIMMGNPSSIEAALMRQSMPVVIRSVIFLTVAALSLCVYCIIRANGGSGSTVLYGSIYIICQTLWSLSDADVINILAISNECTDVAGYFFIIFRMTLLIAFAREFVAGKRQMPLTVCIWVMLFVQTVQVALYLLGIYRLYDMHRTMMLVASVTMACFALCMLRELLHRRSPLLALTAFGAVTTAALSIISHFLYLSPSVSVAYQKVYRPFMAANDWIITIVLVATDVMSAFLTISSKVRNAEAIAQDATTQAQEYQALADQDSLTGLMNHRAIMECVEAYSQGVTPFAIGFVDLDDFRSVNSKYGHIVGDEVIRFVAKTMRSVFGDQCGRHGGDEFLFLLNRPEQLEHLQSLLERYQQKMSQEFVLRDTKRNIKISSSVGVVVVRKLPQSHNTIIERADALMYRVKARGKGHYSIEEL